MAVIRGRLRPCCDASPSHSRRWSTPDYVDVWRVLMRSGIFPSGRAT